MLDIALNVLDRLGRSGLTAAVTACVLIIVAIGFAVDEKRYQRHFAAGDSEDQTESASAAFFAIGVLAAFAVALLWGAYSIAALQYGSSHSPDAVAQHRAARINQSLDAWACTKGWLNFAGQVASSTALILASVEDPDSWCAQQDELEGHIRRSNELALGALGDNVVAPMAAIGVSAAIGP